MAAACSSRDRTVRRFARNLAGGASLAGQVPLVRIPARPRAGRLLLGKSPEASPDSYVEVLSWRSLEEPFVLRVLKEKRTGRLEAFLLHPLPDRYRFAFLKIEGLDRDFLTDVHGRVSLGERPIDFGRDRVRIIPPSAVFRLGPAGDEEPIRASGTALASGAKRMRPRLAYAKMGDTQVLKVRVPAFAGKSGGGERVVLVLGGERVRISVPLRGVSIFEDVEPGQELQINLYE